jgi:predicted dehydrogenase
MDKAILNPTAVHPLLVVHGTGSIGMRHLRVLRDRLGLETRAFPVRPERCEQLIAEGFNALSDRASLKTAGPLAVVVCTDTGRHVADALEWLPYGDVLIEKPLATSIRGLTELDATARDHGHRVFVAYYLRFDPILRAVRHRLLELGRLLSVRIECQSYLPDWRPDRDYRSSYSARADEGGVLQDLAHELDYAIWLFGRTTHVICCSSNGGSLGIESEETADLLWETNGSAVVSVRLDYLARMPRRRLSVVGELGELEADLITGTLRGKTTRGPVDEHMVRDRDGLLGEQALAFLSPDAEETALATVDEGAFSVALTAAARRSAVSGHQEAIADWR